MRLEKTYTARIKAGPIEEGTFEALVSVFGNVDLVGDRVVKGAFQKSLGRWQESGDPIPVIFAHQWDSLDAHVGEVLEAEERDEGLWVKGQLDMEDPSGRKLWRKMSRRLIKEFSFAYDVLDERRSKEDGANELLELDLLEVGPCLKGANPATELLGVKDDSENGKARTGAKRGRVLSAKNEQSIRDAVNLLTGVLKQIDAETDPADEGSDEAKARAKADTAEELEPRSREAALRALAEATLTLSGQGGSP